MGKLRIYLDQRFKASSSGPQMFMSRLLETLEKEHKVEFTSKKAHIALGVIFRNKRSGCKSIIRVDGCYYNQAYSSSGMNRGIASSIRKSDGVIYQSKFSKRLCEKILEVKASKYVIIPNGVSQKWISSVEPAKFSEENVFVAVAKWRNSKRPRSIIKAFLESDIPNSKLIMVGKYQKGFKHPRLSFVGKKSAKEVVSYIKGAKALVHICMIESCSNAVVEALSAGIPVVCNNIGGTPELVGSDGIVVDLDKKFKFRFINKKNVDNVDREKLMEGMKRVLSTKWNIKRPDLDIKKTAQKYYEFFMSVL